MTTDKTLYNTAPCPEGRPDKEIKTYELLSRLGMEFERVEHGPAMTIADCTEIDYILGTKMCKNLLLCNSSKKDFYMLMLPGEMQLDSKVLRDKLGCSRLSFAPGEYMESLLGILPGSLTVLSLMNDLEGKVTLVIEESLLTEPYIGCHPCVNTASLKLKTDDILNIFLPYVNHIPRIIKL